MYDWTSERDALVRSRYDSRVRGRAAEIARSLGWPVWVVKKRARELCLLGPRARWQDWTSSEVAFLETHAGTRHVHWIAQKLKRSETSVILKLKRLHISRRIREGYNMRDLELCLGLDHRKIEALVASGKLDAEREGRVHGQPWLFTHGAVRNFVRRYPNDFRLDRVDQLWFLDLVFRGHIGAEGHRTNDATEAA